ncbi:uncharacterized protein LOC111047762 [Nilaparvata lugens]|uniref:uncharacterized protein LOC111047762 n=1 Tax=Nilaparvata lugens TaxID=108931 RepID=UPI00193C9F96|nr:uncharacterized protein LOC111047762 [Nilaparvata lugens]
MAGVMCLREFALILSLAIVSNYISAASASIIVSSVNSAQFHHIECKEDHDCYDFRLICDKNNHTCQCTQFYYWDEGHKECILNTRSLEVWLGNLSVEPDPSDKSSSRIESMFWVQAFAGITAITILILISIVCFVVFCYCNKETHSDREAMLANK